MAPKVVKTGGIIPLDGIPQKDNIWYLADFVVMFGRLKSYTARSEINKTPPARGGQHRYSTMSEVIYG
jgi:hypothetical protein